MPEMVIQAQVQKTQKRKTIQRDDEIIALGDKRNTGYRKES